MTKIQLYEITPDELTSQLEVNLLNKFKELLNSTPLEKPEDYLTRDQTSKLLDIDLSTLWAWTKKGKLKAYGIGNRVYYKRSEIEEALTPL